MRRTDILKKEDQAGMIIGGESQTLNVHTAISVAISLPCPLAQQQNMTG
jgi:hypothetical protein